MKWNWIRPVCIVLLFAGACICGAESPGDGPRAGEGVAESRKLLEEVLMARLTRELSLEDGQTVLLVQHMTEFRDRMIALRRERAQRLNALRKAVRESKDEERIGDLMEKVRALNKKTALARDDVFDFEGFELTVWQRARLLIFLSDFEGDMRRLLHRARERRSGASPRRLRPRDGFHPDARRMPGPELDRPNEVQGSDTDIVAPASDG